MAVVQQSVRDGRNDKGVAWEFVAYSIDWLRRLLPGAGSRSSVWLLPNPHPDPSPTGRSSTRPFLTTRCTPLSGGCAEVLAERQTAQVGTCQLALQIAWHTSTQLVATEVDLFQAG